MIEINGLCKEYGDVIAINGVSLTIPQAEIYGLIGPNGAGKTTLMRIICGLLEPTQGQVRVNGIDVRREPEQVRGQIGYLADFFSLYDDLKVWEYLDYFAHAYKLSASDIPDRTEEALTQAGLITKRDSLIQGLSRGMKQRLGIARAMIHKPQVLVLDEPASGLDPKARIELRDLLLTARDQGTTILISSHILSELEGFCTSIGIMERGRLIKSGRVEEITSPTLLQHQIRLRWLGEAASLIQTVLQQHPGTSAVHLNLRDGVFAFAGNDEQLAHLLAALIAAGVQVVAFQEIKLSFEEMYMKTSSHEVM
jgi:ABC-2 type transport system ATP-binding protein